MSADSITMQIHVDFSLEFGSWMVAKVRRERAAWFSDAEARLYMGVGGGCRGKVGSREAGPDRRIIQFDMRWSTSRR